MNYSYEDIKKTVEEMDFKEGSIEKSLRKFGYKTFPEAGLNEIGRDRLIAEIVEIEEKEASLVPIKKEKKIRAKTREGVLIGVKQEEKINMFYINNFFEKSYLKDKQIENMIKYNRFKLNY